ncbi:exonuclease DPD1, chloroplastic/mitochondrial [Malania oleifera]|uniref:exonuclease DPD1, chloroplastic/mitochondrial n=1 Tax=Malania oleifera TaxID=397392 RepID=UPI0025ADE8B1|nr:exonuclease DPD1, chloroplastic/mitochondrial [Malania oleifera]XP_057962982.1 exonuclease DPD1, chloroplastic/mitochondrial [Malania oleifera]XP_057962983.1 exonuclease DPD1, chloroplastic/mitochondrial [Malania oleifera]
MTVTMYFSIFQAPRSRIDTLAVFGWESFRSLSKTYKNSPSSKLFASNTYGVGEHNRRSIRRTITTKTETGKKNTQSSKRSSVKHEVLDETVSTRTELNINKSEITEFQRLQYCGIQQKIAENKDLASLVTVIVFDIETTGFSRVRDRIIEIALQDLTGGENSTFQTLVNPECYVPNPHVHGITNHMVNRPEVPRMEDLIPILLQYVKSRQKPGGYVLWVAHNARSFDVPFLINEFSRCSTEVPENWRFVDTIPLAREKNKSEGLKVSSGTSLQALREFYKIQLIGSAHRAMSDVNTLSLVLQRLTFDLKVTVSGLVERSFTAQDMASSKKKKKSV